MKILTFAGSSLASLSAVATATPVESKAISKIDLNTIFPKREYSEYLGLSSGNIAILFSEIDSGDNVGDIVRWDIEKKNAKLKVPLGKWTETMMMTLSPDGKTIATSNQRSQKFFPHVKAYYFIGYDASNLKMKMKVKYSENKDDSGYLFLPDDKKFVVIKAQMLIPYKGDKYYVKDRFEWLNIKTGKVEKKLFYNPARGADAIALSSDKKYLVCVFTEDTSDYEPERVDRAGVVDVLDAKTGKIVWHLEGTDKKPLGFPFFFVSPTRFVSSDSEVDITKRQIKPLPLADSSRHYLSGVPRHSAYALFSKLDGMELWNWDTKKLLRRWPTLKGNGQISWSPDLKTFSYRRASIVQFWKFDPKWLK